MAINQLSLIDEAIKKFGGGDAAYEQKLKEHIRNSLGYSNYVSQMERETGSVPTLGSLEGLSPTGIKSRISSRFGMQTEKVGSLEKIAGAIDTTAGTLASAQAARERKAAEEMEGKFEPQDWLDKQLAQFIIDRPKNPDGTEMTKEELQQQLFGKIMGEGEAAETLFQPGLNEEVIKQRIAQRLPADYDQRKAYYQARMSGASKTDSEKLQDFDDYKYNRMSTGQKTTYELLNPTEAVKAQEQLEKAKQAPGLEDALQPKQTEDSEYTVEAKMKFSDLVNQFGSSVDEAELIKTAKPTYTASLQGDIYKFFSDLGHKISNEEQYEVKEKKWYLPSTFEKGITTSAESLDEIKETDDYKTFVTKMESLYRGILDKGEIEAEIADAIVSGNPLSYIENMRKSKDELIQDQSYRESVWSILNQ